MPTPAERKALVFLAGVIVLGGGVRVVRAAWGDAHDDPATRAALARQLAAVDSAHQRRTTTRTLRARKGGESRRRSPTGVPRDSSRAVGPPAGEASVQQRVDLDVATADAIEALPRIGPVLARRIVDDRDANGPFGSLDGFQRVRGVGPALARQLEGRVTFSGTARPSNAVEGSRLSRSSAAPKPARRGHRK